MPSNFKKIKKEIASALGLGVMSMEERLETYRVLSSYVKNKIDPEVLFARKRRSGSKAMRSAYAKVKRGLDEGISLAHALRPVIPPDEFMFIETAEVQSTMDVMLEELVNMVSQKSAQKKQFLTSMTMPFVIYLIGVFLLVGVAVFMAPMIIDMVTDPKEMLWVIDTLYPLMSGLVWILVTVVPAVFVYLIWYLPNGRLTKTRRVLDSYIPFSTFKTNVASQFLIVTASSLQGSLALTASLVLQSRSAAPYARSWLKTLSARFVDSSYNDVEALDIGLLTAREMDTIEDFALTHDFSEAMVRLGRESLQRNSEVMARQSKVISLLFGATFILFVVGYIGILMLYFFSNSSTQNL